MDVSMIDFILLCGYSFLIYGLGLNKGKKL